MNLRPLNKQSSMPTTTPSITLCALANPMQTCQHPITVPLFQTNVKTPHATLIKSDLWEINRIRLTSLYLAMISFLSFSASAKSLFSSGLRSVPEKNQPSPHFSRFGSGVANIFTDACLKVPLNYIITALRHLWKFCTVNNYFSHISFNS